MLASAQHVVGQVVRGVKHAPRRSCLGTKRTLKHVGSVQPCCFARVGARCHHLANEFVLPEIKGPHSNSRLSGPACTLLESEGAAREGGHDPMWA